MIVKIVLLECITNLHVGSGDVNYNIIDNEVERDPVTGYPTINASGVKGALREYFSGIYGKDAKVVNKIFGDSDRSGSIKILAADLLARPARASAGDKAYQLVSTEEAIDRFHYVCKEFLNKDISVKEENGVGAVEGISLTEKIVKHISFDQVYLTKVTVLSEQEFSSIDLPVLARNKLNNGKSDNLWYEEIVPHKSIFFFPVIVSDDDKDTMDQFVNNVDKKVIQFGGNATIGYGLCKATVIG